MLHLVLESVQVDRIGRARITNNGVSAEAEAPRGCYKATAPVSKAVTIAFHWDRRNCHQMIWTFQIGEAREVHVQHGDHRRYLREFEVDLTPDMDTHDDSSFLGSVAFRCDIRRGLAIV